jgi:hypothetical protein
MRLSGLVKKHLITRTRDFGNWPISGNLTVWLASGWGCMPLTVLPRQSQLTVLLRQSQLTVLPRDCLTTVPWQGGGVRVGSSISPSLSKGP